jgi:hypothetical protein
MAYVKLVTNKTKVVVRNISMAEETTAAVDKVAVALESLICEDRDILHVEVDYTDCVGEEL